jgi:hypothetical protein
MEFDAQWLNGIAMEPDSDKPTLVPVLIAVVALLGMTALDRNPVQFAAMGCAVLTWPLLIAEHRNALSQIRNMTGNLWNLAAVRIRFILVALIMPIAYTIPSQATLLIALSLMAIVTIVTRPIRVRGLPSAKLWLVTSDFIKNQSWIGLLPIFDKTESAAEVWLARQILSPISQLMQVSRRVSDDKALQRGTSGGNPLYHRNAIIISILLAAIVALEYLGGLPDNMRVMVPATIGWLFVIIAQDIRASVARLSTFTTKTVLAAQVAGFITIGLWALAAGGTGIQGLLLGIAAADVISTVCLMQLPSIGRIGREK